VNKKKLKSLTRRDKIKLKIRKKITGTEQKPRLVVFRSLNHIYTQLIDDNHHKTILSVASNSKELEEKLKSLKGKIEKSKTVGKLTAELALSKNIKEVVFDRGGYLYHGRVKAVAEGAREAGLKF
jgi:large subunit ribosomal protein L18